MSRTTTGDPKARKTRVTNQRDLKLPELLSRSDLIETEVNIARAVLLDWEIDQHIPTRDDLRQLSGILSEHRELDATVRDASSEMGQVTFEKAKADLVARYEATRKAT
jgi:hypothetical protein